MTDKKTNSIDKITIKTTAKHLYAASQPLSMSVE